MSFGPVTIVFGSAGWMMMIFIGGKWQFPERKTIWGWDLKEKGIRKWKVFIETLESQSPLWTVMHSLTSQYARLDQKKLLSGPHSSDLRRVSPTQEFCIKMNWSVWNFLLPSSHRKLMRGEIAPGRLHFDCLAADSVCSEWRGHQQCECELFEPERPRQFYVWRANDPLTPVLWPGTTPEDRTGGLYPCFSFSNSSRNQKTG